MGNRKPPPSETNAFGNAPMPTWFWLLLIGVLGLIFWQFVPKSEIQVLYYPWFIEQVQAGNIKSLTIQGNELRGTLADFSSTGIRRARRRPSSEGS